MRTFLSRTLSAIPGINAIAKAKLPSTETDQTSHRVTDVWDNGIMPDEPAHLRKTIHVVHTSERSGGGAQK